MQPADPPLALGTPCTVGLVDGTRLEGVPLAVAGGWLRLEHERGEVVVNLAQVTVVAPPGVLPARRERKRRAPGAPGRPWQDDDLRLLADAFLDGAVDRDLAREFDRTPAIVRQLREAFEAARGELDEDALGEVARSWVPRWRRVLAG